jgi:hypothetical protein
VTLALFYVDRKLKPYFQACQVIVLTDLPLRQILYKPGLSGYLVKWAIEMGEYGLQYQLRTTIKGQSLANIIAKCSFTKPSLLEIKNEVAKNQFPTDPWMVHIDEESNTNGSGAWLMLNSHWA